MRVLVTGGAGFIGSHVVDKLLDAGHEPRVFDLAAPAGRAGEVETVYGYVTDHEALERAMAGCDAVIHLAAVADVADVEAAPDHAENVNARGTLAVLESARRTGVKRVVYGSTVWVYSDCEPSAVDEETLIAPPRHLYTATKLAGELYCHSYAELYGTEYTVLRFGIPYGPRARDAAVIPMFVEKAMAGEPLTIAGTGGQSRRFVYVEDLADGIVRGLEPVAANRTYNLSGAETVTILDIAETVRGLFGDTEIVHTPARAGDFPGKEVSSERAERELGWRASTPFAEGVQRYVEWRRGRAAEPARRVLVLSADIGEGHDLPARAVAAELTAESPGIEVSVVDGLAAMGRPLQMLVRDASRFTFRWLPWIYEVQYFFLTRFRPTRWFAHRLGTLLTGRRMLNLVRAHGADAVVSTYPGVTAVLGELRRQGRLTVPAFSSITDLAGLHYWAHPGIDLHFVTHPESIEEVERIAGPGSVRWARPPTSPGFMQPRSREDARRAFGLPAEGAVIVVSGGGWGVGDLRGAIRTALDIEHSTVICIAGRNEDLRGRLERSFGDQPRVRVIGFTDRMSDLLAAADALVHSTAGLTVLEAIVRGCPVVSYGFGVGHVRVNNRALRRFGLARTAGSRARLAETLRQALAERPLPDTAFTERPSTASFVLHAEQRVRPLPVWRLRLRRAVATATATLLLVGWSLATDDPYPLFARTLDARPMSSVPGVRSRVGLLIDAPPAAAPGLARELSRNRARASFALSGAPSAATLEMLASLGDEAMPRARGGAPVRWLRTRRELKRTARRLGVSDRLFAVPSDGFTFGQYLLARRAGARPVDGAVEFDGSGHADRIRPGDVVRVTVGSGRGASAPLDSALTELSGLGLRAVPVGALVRAGSHKGGHGRRAS